MMLLSHASTLRRLLTVATVAVALLTPTVSAWSSGDLVPVNVFIRINKTTPTTSSPIPLDFCPRFGWNKLVQVPSIDFSSNESDVAIKFEIGRGVNKQTKWMALKELPRPTNGITTAKHLTMVVFQFGYQQGAFGRFTSFKALATYSEHPHEVITIKYHWDEHRSFNPHTALGVVSGISVLLVVLLMHRFSTDALTSPLMARISVVRDRSD